MNINDKINDLYVYIINKIDEYILFDEKVDIILNDILNLTNNKIYEYKINNLKIIIIICLFTYINIKNKLKQLIILLRRINEYNTHI